MDFSQLPKMSKTPTVQNTNDEVPDATMAPSTVNITPHASPEPRVVYVQAPYEPGFGGVWLSLVAGIIFLAMGATFGRWLIATLSGREFATGWLQPDGVTPVKYFELQGGTAWTEAGLFLMGIALLLDAAILGISASRGRPNRALLLVAVAITAVAMLINAGVVAYLFSFGIFPLTSLIALGVGGFVVFDHGPMLRAPRSSGLPSS